MNYFDKLALVIGAVLLAVTLAVIGAGLAGVFGHRPEQHCRIEVYADGSAEPLCDAGWQPTRPINEWPIVRVEA